MIERGRREQSRLRVRLPARIVTLSADSKAILVDLSRTGARLQIKGEIQNRGEAVVQWCGFDCFATIVWARRGFCGLHFEKPIPHDWLLATRQRNEAECLPEDRELARLIARDWVNGALRV